MNYFFFLMVYLIQVLTTYPTFDATCMSTKTSKLEPYILYFVHHLLDVYLFWSPLFLFTKVDAALHILAILVVAVHWITYNNRCVLTVVMNRSCAYNEGDWLDSLKNRLGLRAFNEYFHFIWLALAFLYDAYILRLFPVSASG